MLQKKHLALISVLLIVSNLLGSGTMNQTIKEIASSEKQWTGIALSNTGRIFVNYPNWSEDVSVSVAELVDGNPIAYPSKAWNDRNNIDSFNAVQSVVIDAKNHLWVLDTNNARFKGVQKNGPTLFQFDLNTNSKVKSFSFPKGVYHEKSYFNDVRIDTKKEIAYLSDSGDGAIIVLDLKTGKSKRLLDTHPSVKSEVNLLVADGRIWKRSVDVDGIDLSKNGEYLYYSALSGHTLYRINTTDLSNESLLATDLAKKVETIATIPATDGMMFDKNENLWLGALESNGVNMLDSNGKLVRVLQNPDIRWADSFAIDDKSGNIYFTTSQISLPKEERGLYQIFSYNPKVVSDKSVEKSVK